jgi:hypothetical protein
VFPLSYSIHPFAQSLSFFFRALLYIIEAKMIVDLEIWSVESLRDVKTDRL